MFATHTVTPNEGWTVCYNHYVPKNDESMDHTSVLRSKLWLIRGSGVGVLEEISCCAP